MFENMKNEAGDGDGEGGDEDDEMWDDYAMSGSDQDEKIFKT